MSRSEVGCHSLIKPVTAGFAPSCAAYAQTDGPKGVRQQATTVTTATASAWWPREGRSAMSAIQASPSTAGARKKLPWTFAHRTAIGTTNHNRRGCVTRSTTRKSVNANRAIAMSCGRSASAGAETANAPSASHAARPDARPLATAQLEDRGRDQPDQGRPEQHEPGPTGHPVNGGQDDLRAPLLVEPWRARDRERPRVDGRDAAGCQDLLARPKVVRQVGRWQRRDQRGQHGQRHREERPQIPEAHETASYAGPVRGCTAPKVLGISIRARLGFADSENAVEACWNREAASDAGFDPPDSVRFAVKPKIRAILEHGQFCPEIRVEQPGKHVDQRDVVREEPCVARCAESHKVRQTFPHPIVGGAPPVEAGVRTMIRHDQHHRARIVLDEVGRRSRGAVSPRRRTGLR